MMNFLFSFLDILTNHSQRGEKQELRIFSRIFQLYPINVVSF